MENLVSLLCCFNFCCVCVMEGVVFLCQIWVYVEILFEYWLFKLLEQGEGDLMVLVWCYEWDMDVLWQDLLSWLDKQLCLVCYCFQFFDYILRLMQEVWLIVFFSGEVQICSVYLLMVLVEKQNLIQCDGLWLLLMLGQCQLECLCFLLDVQFDECLLVQQEVVLVQFYGGDVEFVGCFVGSELNVDGFNLVLQNVLDKFIFDVIVKVRDGQIDLVFGCDMEICQMVDIFFCW